MSAPRMDDLTDSIANASWPLPTVMTAGQPTERQLRQLADAGVATVIDIRPAGEPRGFDEARAVAATGMRYEPLPVTGDTLDARTFDAFRALMRDRGDEPVVVHCASANRVGAVMLPYLVLDEGKSIDEATAMAGRIGLRSPEMLAKARAYLSAQGAQLIAARRSTHSF